MPLKPKILITDATNLVGFQLVKDLVKQGENIRVLQFEEDDFSHLDSFKNNLEFIKADLFDVSLLEDAMQGIEQIYHCKELFSFHPQEEQKILDINIIGTRNIVNIALSMRIKKIVFLSSTLAYGSYQFKDKITEKIKWIEHKDNTNYSISKHYAELEIHRAQVEGLETIIVNPSFIIGDSIQENDIYNLKNIAKAEYRFYPKGIYGFVQVEDVSNACILLMKSDISDEKFILSAENLTYKFVLEKLNPNLAKKKLFSRTNSTKENLIWRINSVKSIFMNSKAFLSKEVYGFNGKTFEFEGNKIKEKLNFEYSKIL